MGASHDSTNALPPALARSTPYLLARAVRASARLAEAEFGAERLRFSHYVTLCWVDHLGPTVQVHVANTMGVDPSDLVTVLRTLQADGMLERTIDPEDRRRNLIACTGAGRVWLDQRSARAEAFERELTRRLADGGHALRRDLGVLAEGAFVPGGPVDPR